MEHRHRPLLICASLILLALNTSLAQEVRYQSDTTCGCDILYVDGFETIRDSNRYGFRRYDGTVIVPPTFQNVATFQNGYCRVWMHDTLAGLIDTLGRQVVPCIYNLVGDPSENRILVAKNNRYGYTDLDGNLVIPLQFYNAGLFHQGRAPVAIVVDSFFLQCSFIDTLGNLLFPPIFENVMPFDDGIAPVRRYEKWGLIDTLGNEIVNTRYEILTIPEQGIFFAGDDNGLALFKLSSNRSGFSTSQLTPPVYMPYTTVSEGRIGVSRINNGLYGFLDLNGNEVVPCIYDEIGRFHLGRALVRKDTLYGIIDTLGRTILPLRYHLTTPKGEHYVYHDSLALVELNGLHGYADLNGNIVIPIQFKEAYHFTQGRASALLDGGWGYIDTHGFPFLPFIFDLASPFKHGRAEIFLQGNRYTIDLDGRCVKNCNGIKSFR